MTVRLRAVPLPFFLSVLFAGQPVASARKVEYEYHGGAAFQGAAFQGACLPLFLPSWSLVAPNQLLAPFPARPKSILRPPTLGPRPCQSATPCKNPAKPCHLPSRDLASQGGWMKRLEGLRVQEASVGVMVGDRPLEQSTSLQDMETSGLSDCRIHRLLGLGSSSGVEQVTDKDGSSSASISTAYPVFGRHAIPHFFLV
ncbi:hypothetical protein GE21DRAFT_3015 [Neurospora crassa]|uniref:Uncharacterized protein n=2 Tax=Neurospora crassa TaxID=5141 RepID=Q1K8I5_NEUCR|nr:hypothetical protein NCU05437 [Neurospora crassa OR74A]EAA34024.1 hypothetical protein NCU05437 [Neurospora crassa OR74A]KHE85266.1 hypothetical protein GE21DRAFT_3015 [Neurospora crassa]CAD01116.1 hypothetical protein [Neurospora crassa]|eukprot:XP_963260.1 hypothetical protein NCU05437 [Neurospora crassa OR74A]